MHVLPGQLVSNESCDRTDHQGECEPELVFDEAGSNQRLRCIGGRLKCSAGAFREDHVAPETRETLTPSSLPSIHTLFIAPSPTPS